MKSIKSDQDKEYKVNNKKLWLTAQEVRMGYRKLPKRVLEFKIE